MKETILCAAIWFKAFPTPQFGPNNLEGGGLVLCGYRHSDIIQQHVVLLGKRLAEMGNYEQGFLTNFNRFVGRSEALQITLRASQIKDLNKIRGHNLYSEDLY